MELKHQYALFLKKKTVRNIHATKDRRYDFSDASRVEMIYYVCSKNETV